MSREYYIKNRLKILEQKKVYTAQNKERIAAYRKKRYEKNKAAVQAEQAVYRATNKERIYARQRIYRDINPEKRREQQKAYAAKNKSKRAAANKRWRLGNPQRVLSNRRAYCSGNKERIAEAHKTWRLKNRSHLLYKARLHQKNNLEFFRLCNARRKQRERNQTHPHCDHKVVKAVHSRAREIMFRTGIKHHVDHIIPLIRGGFHHHENIQPLPAPLNQSKRANPFWSSPSPEYKDWRDVPTYLWPDKLVPGFLARLLID